MSIHALRVQQAPTVSLATGQTGDDSFNSTPINPDLDDPEQLTDESIQSFLTLIVQLQWLVALGRLVTHAQVTTLSKLKLSQKKLQRAYSYVLKITEFLLVYPYLPNKWVVYNTSLKFPSSTHTHTHTHTLNTHRCERSEQPQHGRGLD